MEQFLIREDVQDFELFSAIPPNRLTELILPLKKFFPKVFAFDSPERLFPLSISQDSNNQKYICCDANRYMGSTRSPWTNVFHPPLPDAPFPNEQHRHLEELLNNAFSQYAKSYYAHDTITSVYCLGRDSGVMICFLIKSSLIEIAYLIDINEKLVSYSTYSLSVAYSIKLTEQEFSDRDLGDFCFCLYFRHNRSEEIKLSVNTIESHVRNVGRLIEQVDNEVFTKLRAVYPMQTRLILQNLRTEKSMLPPKQTIAFKEELSAALTSRSDA
ncbi:hypothetical protein Aperf_G00000099519 [Anoplocephala perfoliata]